MSRALPLPLTPAAAATAVLLASLAAGGARKWRDADRLRIRLDLPGGVGSRVPGRVAAALDSAGVARSQHPTLVRIWGAAVVVAAVTAVALPAGPLVAGMVVGGPPAALLAASGRAARRRTRELPVALEAIAAGLRAGHALPVVVADVGRAEGPLATEFTDIARQSDGGRPLAEALRGWSRSRGDRGTRLAAAALAVATEVGGPGADALDATAGGLRDRAAVDDEIAALSVQARSSAFVLSLTPLVFTALLATADASSARFLFGTRLGWGCLMIGLGLDVLGALWMRRLVRAAR